MTVHCAMDQCDDSRGCRCLCEDCHFARLEQSGAASSGVELALQALARSSWLAHSASATRLVAWRLTEGLHSVRDKVDAIARYVRESMRTASPADQELIYVSADRAPADVDDAVAFAAAMCLALGIPCRIVGARFGQLWTCSLGYQDGGEWRTMDVQDAPHSGEPDERVEVAIP